MGSPKKQIMTSEQERQQKPQVPQNPTQPKKKLLTTPAPKEKKK